MVRCILPSPLGGVNSNRREHWWYLHHLFLVTISLVLLDPLILKPIAGILPVLRYVSSFCVACGGKPIWVTWMYSSIANVFDFISMVNSASFTAEFKKWPSFLSRRESSMGGNKPASLLWKAIWMVWSLWNSPVQFQWLRFGVHYVGCW